MTAAWTETQTALTFRAGERSLLSVRFRCLALKAHFSELSDDPLQPAPPFGCFATGVDVLMIRSHPINEPLPLLARLPEAIRYVPSQYSHCSINLELPFDAYLNGFSAKSRSTLMRKVRKFEAASQGAIDFREFADGDAMAQFCHYGREVSRKTYQERLLDAGLPEEPQFLHDACEAAANGAGKGYILFLQKRPIAYLYCPIADGAVFYEYVGYDPEFQNHSPGTVLLYLVLQRLMTQGGNKIFDFTEGESQQKAFWATHQVRCANIFYFRPTLRNYLLLSLHAATVSLSASLVALLDRFGLKARVKKLLRAAA